MNDATVNSVCLIDDAYLRFDGFLSNVKGPLVSLNTNFVKAVNDLSAAAVQDQQLAQNVVDIGAKFDILKQQAKDNKADVTSLSVPLKAACDKAWDKVISTCETAKAETDASGKKVNKALTDVQEVSFFLIYNKTECWYHETVSDHFHTTKFFMPINCSIRFVRRFKVPLLINRLQLPRL